jgi:hypothetical protein
MSIKFTDANNGWTVGSSGATAANIILHTTDGGTTWNVQTGPTTTNMNFCSFPSSMVGWAGGNGGEIFNTVNGGTTWTAQTNPSVNSIRGIDCPTIMDGWAVGDAGSIVMTSNGGTTWSMQTSGTTQILRGLKMLNVNTGWAVGNAGTILKYVNTVGISSSENGSSVSVYPNPGNGLFQVSFANLSNIKMEVYNMLGVLILKTDKINQSTFDLDLSDYANGAYFIKTYSSEGINTKKVIINK